MNKKHIFITGAGGYIGSEMVPMLLEDNYYVSALDRYFFGDVFKKLKKSNNLTVIREDIRSFNKKLLKNVDIVVDLASISNDPSSEINPKITWQINHRGAVRVASLAKEMGVERYIFSSSCSIYGGGKETFDEISKPNPISVYAKSKLAAEEDLLSLASSNFAVSVLRNATVYGVSKKRMRFDLMINVMTLNAWKNKKIYVLGGGTQWRPLIHVSDCINAFKLIAAEKDLKKINRQIFNIGSNSQNYQVIKVARRFLKFFPDLIIEIVPDDPDPRNYKVNFNKISKIFNFKTKKNIDDGIKEILESLRKGEITESLKTSTLNFYKFLIEGEKLLSSVRLRNRLF